MNTGFEMLLSSMVQVFVDTVKDEVIDIELYQNKITVTLRKELASKKVMDALWPLYSTLLDVYGDCDVEFREEAV